MSVLKNILLLLTTTALTSFATTITFDSTQDPNKIAGGPAGYEVFYASLTAPSTPTGLWTLTIGLNYDGTVSNNMFNSFVGPGGGITPDYTVGDFLIEQTVNNVTTDYGVVLSNHLNGQDGSNYTPGDIYAIGGTKSFQSFVNGSGGFATSPQIIGSSPGVAGFPVWLDPGGTQVGTGSLTITKSTAVGAGTTSPMYIATDTFSAPSFLDTSDPFTIWFTSALCANGVVTGTGSFPPPSTVPEPGTLTLVSSALLMFGLAGFRRRR